MGSDVQICSTLKDRLLAFTSYTQHRHDVILMDMRMPNMDGYSSVEKIRKWEKEQHITPAKIIAVTANGLDWEKQRMIQIGCDGHLVKPFSRDQLLQKIWNVTR